MIKTTTLSALVLTGLMAAGAAQAAETTHKAAVATHAAASTAVVAASAAVVAAPKDKAPAKVEATATTAAGANTHGDDKSIPTTPKIGPRGKDDVAVKANVKAADVKVDAKAAVKQH